MRIVEINMVRYGVIISYHQTRAPNPPPGAPARFSLRWIGMEVLNNSTQIMLSDGTILYDEKDDQPSQNQPAKPGEEPYVAFMYVNGKGGKYSTWETAESYWCCGEETGIGVTHDGTKLNPWEPDQDNRGEEKKDLLNKILEQGFKVFPEAGEFGAIDRNYGLIVGITLMERDWDIITIEKNKGVIDTVMNFVSAVFTAAHGAFTLDPAKVAGGMKSFAQLAYQNNNKSFGTDVKVEKDPDDYVGTEVWKITRERAISVTSKNGAFPFWIEMPTEYHRYCDNAFNICPQTSPIATMITKQYFCLIREGVNVQHIENLCSPDQAVSEFIINPVYTDDMPQKLSEFQSSH